jgi:hypothetical protein
MKTAPIALDAIHHRLLEGVLLRLARQPDAGDFVLRGGILMRHWFHPVPRPVDDLDFVVSFPFSLKVTTHRFLTILAAEVADGVTFDIPRTRFEEIRLDTGSGVRIFVSGTADGTEIDFTVDITFGPHQRPDPVLGELPTAYGEAVRLWMCRPESVVGHKMQAMYHRGMLGWRPKDLEDMRLLLTRVPMDAADLRRAITAYLGDAGGTGEDARAIFGASSWWDTKLSSARWHDFVNSHRGQLAPRNLADVVAEVAGALAPILEGLP